MAAKTGLRQTEARKSSSRLWLLSCTALAAAIGSPAFAQETESKPAVGAEGSAAQPAAQGAALEEIIVTAQKRAQNLQDVPISVTVLSGDQVAERNFSTLQDLSRTQPALTFTPSGRAVRISLRGVASGTNPALDQSVVTFVDDIYHGKGRVSGSVLLDIDRIEILKGPQTTFFGNNAIGGAINVQTAKPQKDFGGSIRALYGTQGEYALEGVVNAPVSETLAVRGAFLANGMNGYLNDRTGGGWLPHERNLAGRVSALWTPTDAFQLYLKAEATRNRNQGGGLIQLIQCPPLAPFAGPGLFCTNAIADGADTKLNNIRDQNAGQFLNLDTQDYQATASYDLGPATLTSVTAYSRFGFDNTQDLDTTPDALFGLHQPEDYHQFSQEVRLASDEHGPISYILGGYYQSSRYKDTFETVYSFLSPAINAAPPFAALRPFLPFGQAINYTLDEKTLSAFGSLTWHVTDALSLTAGVRGSSVRKDIDQVIYYGQAANQYGYITPFPANLSALAQTFANGAALGVAGATALSRKDSKVTPTVNVQYKVTPEASLYASYTEGFKAGGFNGAIATGVASQFPFAPERVEAYEAGLRSELFDRRLLFNLTAFRSEYTNLQVAINSNVGGTNVALIQNAASEVSQGVEIESKLAVTRDVSIGTSSSFLDAHYKSYPNAPSTALQRLATGARTQDLSGRPRNYAPKFAGTFYANYKHPITDSLDLGLEADLLHQSFYYLADQDDPMLSQHAYNRLDLRAALSSADSRWEIAVIGKNITNVTILTVGLDAAGAGSYVVSKERPRSVALQLRYKW